MWCVDTDLTYVDEHSLRISEPRDRVWAALNRYVEGSLSKAAGSLLTKILGTEPRGGFEVAESVRAERLSLVGRHRFSRYLLVFSLSDAGNEGTRLAAQTYAEFPGLHGRAYRALVIGSRLHVLATRHLLRSVRRLSQG